MRIFNPYMFGQVDNSLFKPESDFREYFIGLIHRTSSMIRSSRFFNQQVPLYINIPWARLVVDKIGLSCPKQYLNLSQVSRFMNSNVVTVLHKGGYYYILVHDTWEPWVFHHGVRVLHALKMLVDSGLFTYQMSWEISRMCGIVGWDYDHTSAVCAQYIWERFGLNEWEQAMDFRDYPIVADVRKEIPQDEYGQMPKGIQYVDFTRYKGTWYSKWDARKITRKGETTEDGTIHRELKGTQHSGLIIYNWTDKHGGSEEWYRMEFRFTNKYRADLIPELLIGGTSAVCHMLNEPMARMLRQVTCPMNVRFNPVWISPMSPPWLGSLFAQAKWFDPNQQMQISPRRKSA